MQGVNGSRKPPQRKPTSHSSFPPSLFQSFSLFYLLYIVLSLLLRTWVLVRRPSSPPLSRPISFFLCLLQCPNSSVIATLLISFVWSLFTFKVYCSEFPLLFFLSSFLFLFFFISFPLFCPHFLRSRFYFIFLRPGRDLPFLPVPACLWLRYWSCSDKYQSWELLFQLK